MPFQFDILTAQITATLLLSHDRTRHFTTTRGVKLKETKDSLIQSSMMIISKCINEGQQAQESNILPLIAPFKRSKFDNRLTMASIGKKLSDLGYRVTIECTIILHDLKCQKYFSNSRCCTCIVDCGGNVEVDDNDLYLESERQIFHVYFGFFIEYGLIHLILNNILKQQNFMHDLKLGGQSSGCRYNDDHKGNKKHSITRRHIIAQNFRFY